MVLFLQNLVVYIRDTTIRIHIHAEAKLTIMTNEHTSVEKYTSHFIRKCCEMVVCERWVGDWTDCNILTPSSSDYSSTPFSFCWAAQPGVLRAQPSAGSWFSLPRTASRTSAAWHQLTQFSVAPGYIIVWHQPASCERHICTEFNQSTVKVISWYLPPDAPVSRLTAGLKVNMLQFYLYTIIFKQAVLLFLRVEYYEN